MFALDTNTVIYFFKGMGRVAERLLATPPAEVSIPAVVLYELEVGATRSEHAARRSDQLAELEGLVSVLPFGTEEARVAARIRTDLEQRGRAIGPIDVLIAATAVAAGATLVTRNVREFGRVDELTVVSWF